jgi:zinc/manganese transport system ATP-binding protein
MRPGGTGTIAAGAQPTGPAAASNAPVVELCGAATKVGHRLLWGSLDVRVQPGEFVAVLGPNGVGKSTLVKVLLGLHPYAAGRVEVLGRRPGAAGARIGYLPQRRSFDASLRIRGTEVVRLGLDGHRWGLPLPGPRHGGSGRATRARVAEAIELVGAGAYANRPIGACSGGEQQRLLIAQALVRRPRLLLLDEPLDSLDLPNQAATAALVGHICRTQAVAVLMVAHDVNPILPFLDQVVYLGHGAAACGCPREVITGPTLSKLFGTPVEVLHTSTGRVIVAGGAENPLGGPPPGTTPPGSADVR